MKSKYIDTEELSRLHSTIADESWLPFWVSLETGLRVGDVVSIKASAVKDDGIHFKAQKTGKKGIARISKKLREALPKRKRGEYLFPSPTKPGKHITRQAVWKRLKTACKRIGIDPEGISPHSMRKVFSVELYREKGFKAVKEALQHSNSATTEIYSFADWNTGANSELPLKRRDLQLIVKMVIEELAEGYELARESRTRRRKKE